MNLTLYELKRTLDGGRALFALYDRVDHTVYELTSFFLNKI